MRKNPKTWPSTLQATPPQKQAVLQNQEQVPRLAKVPWEHITTPIKVFLGKAVSRMFHPHLRVNQLNSLRNLRALTRPRLPANSQFKRLHLRLKLERKKKERRRHSESNNKERKMSAGLKRNRNAWDNNKNNKDFIRNNKREKLFLKSKKSKRNRNRKKLEDVKNNSKLNKSNKDRLNNQLFPINHSILNIKILSSLTQPNLVKTQYQLQTQSIARLPRTTRMNLKRLRKRPLRRM